MNVANLIQEIDAEIARLQKAKSLLSDSLGVARKAGRPRMNNVLSRPARKAMSAEGRAKIAAAQRARWAKAKKSAKKKTQSKA
jgi:hypothetical protein